VTDDVSDQRDDDDKDQTHGSGGMLEVVQAVKRSLSRQSSAEVDPECRSSLAPGVTQI
jgi:hypothetical protein